jgi:two-component system KDP operon response regulator KdpE
VEARRLEAPMRRLLKTVLAAQGYLVFQAESGRRGQIEAGTRKPDLVILDLGLPDLDGIEVIRQLRACVPIIVLSARAGSAEGRRPRRRCR